MRFYVPEWDDAVDTDYDFVNDELSNLVKVDRDRDFIWDIFDSETTPVDGVLISREQVESSKSKFTRFTSEGVYDDPNLSVPDWMPTISDCGAWGYKSLPFPPYDNDEMLEFYTDIGVTTGVTIDHLIMGEGKERGRLYLNEECFSKAFSESDIPSKVREKVDLMIEEWPETWPDCVREYEPSIYNESTKEKFTLSDFEGSIDDILDHLNNDPRAVHRENDREFRYNLTLDNAQHMFEEYQNGNYSFRLMGAFQGWDPDSYAEAADLLLDTGFRYIGIGGVASSHVSTIKDIVTVVGETIREFEREHQERVDSHVFGFAKPKAFDTVGRAGMSSFDSASMLRSAWTGGSNYHMAGDQKYTAVRVRYATARDGFETAIEKSLRGQEVLRSLRAYDQDKSISDTLRSWAAQAEETLDALEEYVREHRHDDQYNQSRIRDLNEAFRTDFEFGRETQAHFSDVFRKKILKRMRDDDDEDPIDIDAYLADIDTAREILSQSPWCLDAVNTLEKRQGEVSTFDQLWHVVEEYARWVGDEKYLDDYELTLRAEPWKDCDCTICEELGIEVVVFRGNNRNRRRGFHNMHQFYKDFNRQLPRILVGIPTEDEIEADETVMEYLTSEYNEVWREVFDIPVVEIGLITPQGVYEWWETSATESDSNSDTQAAAIQKASQRYEEIHLLNAESILGRETTTRESVFTYSDPEEIREAVLTKLGYDDTETPKRHTQKGLGEF
ncbi:queuine tRNA-ribosyltransferase tRNA-guanine transglycosylase [Halomicroarcula limicola]|uniref:Queuine tRNA-ribosyltransferase tRNA-guanine transglycosylase n=1 Tax=Haloarcula limicola TaxID=1429915 RepID=A0A8J7Y4V7_9EURY|nr:queuine tRNA-ribosyltransferase tRNA-guanine transglycosylase [Halomicroarcula limicola]MBV0924530.1 queuine tRNA-ribosyltransferase tRNA-guanine transglycosylase [Halomicroarcula limicola]